MNKFIFTSLILAGFFAFAHEIGNGDLDGIYKVKSTQNPLQKEIIELLAVSQLPASIKDPLQNELLNSSYLLADRDVSAKGAAFPGDWYIGSTDKLFYARTMPRFGAATTLFPVFYTLGKAKQLEVLIHEAIHRLEFLRPNNISEDFVEATVQLIIEDAKIAKTQPQTEKLISAAKIKAWFAATTTRANVPLAKMHWVGIVSLAHHEDVILDGGYTQGLLSMAAPDGVHWYAEVGKSKSTFGKAPTEQPFSNRIDTKNSTTLSDFIKTLKFKVIIGPYLFDGKATSVLDPIKGAVYDKLTRVYVGEFELNALHDGGTGASLSISKPQCFTNGVIVDPAPDASCYAK